MLNNERNAARQSGFSRRECLVRSGLAAGASLILGIFGTGYLLAYLNSIVTATAAGESHLPDWPDF